MRQLKSVNTNDNEKQKKNKISKNQCLYVYMFVLYAFPSYGFLIKLSTWTFRDSARVTSKIYVFSLNWLLAERDGGEAEVSIVENNIKDSDFVFA